MSANNIIYIKRKTNEVFYQPCADSKKLGELKGTYKTLAEAVDKAQELIEELVIVEYGIEFI